MNKTETNTKQKDIIRQETQQSPSYLEWKYKLNQKTGEYEFDSIQLSDGSKIDGDKLHTIMKRTSGTFDLKVGETILKKVARGMAAEQEATRLNEASALLPALQPGDEAEALLLGQFLALQDSGIRCLRRANLPDQGFYHQEKLLSLAHKLLNTANQTMQTVLKYRSKGQQTMQVIHVHNEGQAIVAQNLSSHSQGTGMQEKKEN